MSLVAAGDRNGASLIARRRRLESFAPGGEIVGERDKGPFVRSPFGRSVGGSLARLAGPLSSRPLQSESDLVRRPCERARGLSLNLGESACSALLLGRGTDS